MTTEPIDVGSRSLPPAGGGLGGLGSQATLNAKGEGAPPPPESAEPPHSLPLASTAARQEEEPSPLRGEGAKAIVLTPARKRRPRLWRRIAAYAAAGVGFAAAAVFVIGVAFVQHIE